MKIVKIAHIHVWDQKNKGDRAIVLAVQELLSQKFPQCLIQDYPVETLKEYQEERIKEINDCDFVIIGGGGIFYSYFLPFSSQVIESISAPIYLFGLGYIKEVDAPEWSRDKIESVVLLANKAKRIGVRDYNTQRFLLSNNIEKEKLSVIGDPAICLHEERTDKIPIYSGIKIGLNLNYSGWLGFGKWREDILSSYRELALYFQKEYGAQIYYIKHHPGEDNIYPELNIDGLIIVDLPPNQQKYVYSQLDLIIGMMLHVGVLSVGSSTPEISVAYDIRNYGFAEVIDKKELVIDLDKLKTGILLNRAKEVFLNRDKYRQDFINIRKNICQLEEDFLHSIHQDIL